MLSLTNTEDAHLFRLCNINTKQRKFEGGKWNILDIHASVQDDIIYENDQQDATL
jgi:hypothetical protein